MGVFDWFKLKEREEVVYPPYDYSKIGVDMHSHLLPGIDDGSRSMDETIAMLAKFESLGYRKVVTTPHVMGDYYKNTPETILEGLGEVRKMAKQLNLKIEIEAAAEYYYDESLWNKLINKEQLLTFGENYLLFEFSFHSRQSRINDIIFEMTTQGYQTIIAHFERYTYFLGNIQPAIDLKEKGVKIQMNLNSLTGHYGMEIKAQAERLIDAGVVDFVASDCHRMEHLMKIEELAKFPYVHKLDELNLLNNTL